MCLKAHVLLFILSWPMCAAKVPIGEFFPFGVENGDAVMERSDDGSSPRLPLSIAFPFFDFLHDALWVNVNGAISFVAAISTYTPACKAVTSDHRMIEPFWGDIDIRFTGDIFYRESFDTSVLRKAISEVASAFPDSQNVQLKWVYVITWFNVTFYPGTYNPRNTFQVALTTDGIQSFAIFYYNNITWTTGTSTGGNTSGLGGTPAQAGFDAGDGKTLFMIPGSCMDDIITIGDRSNVDSPGKWLFRVDNSNIQSAGCSTNFTGTFRVAPSFVDTNGHVDIEVSGPCVEEAENATCRFYDPNGNVTDVLAAKLGNQTSMTLLCATPFFYSIGRLRLDLIITHNDSTIKNIFNGYLYVVMPPETDGLLQFDIQPSQNDSDSFELTFTWNPESIGRDINFVDINMFIMKADTKIWQQGLQIAKKVVNNGIFKAVFSDAVLMDLTCGITPIELGVKAAFSVGGGIYDVIANPEHREHLIFTAGTVAVDFLSSVCGPPVRAAACLAWFALDPGPPKNLIPCPPNSTWARADPRFQLDYGCGVVPKPCNYHEGADYCIDSIEPSADGGMQQCCYKDDKILLGPPGGGSAYMSHTSRYGGLLHFFNDILPWIACCNYKLGFIPIPDLCPLYYLKRPSDSSTDYVPPRPAGASGDPHITTFDLLDYTFNGAGEFWMLKNSSVQPVAVQARMEQFLDGAVPKSATVFTAFVMKDQTSPVVQVQKSSVRIVDVLIDGIALDLSNAALRDMPFDGVRVTVLDDLSIVSVSFSIGFSFQISTISGAFSLLAFCSETFSGNKTHGLLGVYDDNAANDLQTPDGTVVPSNSSLEDIHDKFGIKWMISASESLFNYGSKQYSDYNFPNFRPNFNFDPNSASQSAVLVCGSERDCLYDYMTTGSAAIANQTKSFADQFNRTVQLFEQKILLCPALNNPTNGFCQVQNYFPPSTASFLCFEGYKIVGNDILFCNGTYQWNGTAPICVEEASTTQSTISASTQPLTSSLSTSTLIASTVTASTTPAATTSTSEPDEASSLKAVKLMAPFSIALLMMKMYVSFY